MGLSIGIRDEKKKTKTKQKKLLRRTEIEMREEKIVRIECKCEQSTFSERIVYSDAMCGIKAIVLCVSLML